MRSILLTLAALAALAGTATAQIAAPRLNSLGPQASGETNPAITAWDGPSRVMAGWSKVETAYTVGAATTTAAEFAGANVGFVLVGPHVAAAAEATDMDGTDPSSGQPVELKFNSVALAGQIGEVFALGIGQQRRQSPGNNGVEKFTLPDGGASLRLWQRLYFGASGGKETVEEHNVAIAPTEAKRTVLTYALGYHWRDRTNGVHVEAIRNERDPITAGGFTYKDVDTDAVVAEAVWSNVLIGVEGANVAASDLNSGGTAVESLADKLRKASLGWVPAQGAALVASYTRTERTNTTTGATSTFRNANLSLGWHF